MDKDLKKWFTDQMRKASYRYPPRNKAKSKNRVAPATFECEHCGVWIYEGSSEENFKALQEEHPDKRIIREKTKIDHIDPVVDIFDGFVDMGEYVKRMFCPEENFQILCRDCHWFKTQWENYIRNNP